MTPCFKGHVCCDMDRPHEHWLGPDECWRCAGEGEDVKKLRANLATLERLGEAIDGWDSKLDARQSGYSLHVTFVRRVNVMLAVEHAEVMQRCPAMLADALRRLIDLAEGGDE